MECHNWSLQRVGTWRVSRRSASWGQGVPLHSQPPAPALLLVDRRQPLPKWRYVRVARDPLGIADSVQLSARGHSARAPIHNLRPRIVVPKQDSESRLFQRLALADSPSLGSFRNQVSARLFMMEEGRTPRCHQAPIATRGSKPLPMRIHLGRRNSRSTLPMIFPLPPRESRLRLTERAE